MRTIEFLKLTVRRPSESHRRIAVAAAIGTALITALSFVAERWANNHAATESDISAAQSARIDAGLLASELRTARLLPVVLLEYPDVGAVLEQTDPHVAARLNGKLEQLASRTGAAVIYVMQLDGSTIAASNWRRPDSFIGHDYKFRSYFGEALRTGSSELFALGSSSRRPGLFIASRIDRGGRSLGVIVVKVEFDHLEAAWARQPGPTFVTDRDGVVIITSRPEWRFQVLGRLSPEKLAYAGRTMQFGRRALNPIDLKFNGATVRQPTRAGTIDFRVASVPVPLAGGTMHFLQPLAPAAASAAATARLVILAGIILVAVVLALMLRAREKGLLQIATRRTLESEVTLRTAELTELNHRLIVESREREQADHSLRSAREELAQANRLGSLGQITAGVAHEINQPVAAIRTFAETAGQFLDRDRPERARANLDVIVSLTERIGTITAELRAFSRRSAPVIGAINIEPALDGALLLMGDTIRSQGVTLDRPGRQQDLRVMADRVGLEQVFINLIQNGLEALEGWPEPHLHISIALDGERNVNLDVMDNGPGVPARLADEIFTPFVTGRPDGLGLGLGIARDIAREFGGELLLVTSTLGGAGFRLILRRV